MFHMNRLNSFLPLKTNFILFISSEANVISMFLPKYFKHILFIIIIDCLVVGKTEVLHSQSLVGTDRCSKWHHGSSTSLFEVLAEAGFQLHWLGAALFGATVCRGSRFRLQLHGLRWQARCLHDCILHL